MHDQVRSTLEYYDVCIKRNSHCAFLRSNTPTGSFTVRETAKNRAEPPNQLIVGFTQRSVPMSPNPRVFDFASGPARSLLAPLLLKAALAANSAAGPPLGSAPELYQPLHGGAFTGKPAPLSPDPLAAYVFGPGVNHTALQIFTVRPVAVAVLSGKCDGCESLTTATPKATITGPVQVIICHFNSLKPHTFTMTSS